MKLLNISVRIFIFACLGSIVAAASTETNRFSDLYKLIPDGTASGLSDVRVVSSSIATLSSVRIQLRIDGQFNGDLYGYVRHTTAQSTNFCVLLNRAGKTTLSPFGYDDSGLDVLFDDAALNGDIHLYQTEVVPLPNSPLTGIWQPDGRNDRPFTVLDETPRTTTLGSFAGSPASGEWTLFLADLESGGTNVLVSWALELSGNITPEVSWPTPADIVYGTALGPLQLNASTPVLGVFLYRPPAGTILNAGSHVLSAEFIPADSETYAIITTNVAINVLKKPLTIAANNQSKTYGAPLPELTVSYSGFVNGDTPSSLNTPPLIATTATEESPVGTYPITVSGATSDNYSITFVSAELMITRAALIITAANTNKFYGAPLPEFTAIYEGLVAGDSPADLDVPVAFATSANIQSEIGTYPVRPLGADDANYIISFVEGMLVVTPAPTEATLTSSANPSRPNVPVTFTFTVRAASPSVAIPTGPVIFTIDGVPEGAFLSNGVATLTATFPPGIYFVAAQFFGDVHFIGVTQRINPFQIINTPPVVVNDLIWKIPLAKGCQVLCRDLLANDTDIDNDLLSVASVSERSVRGGFLSRSAGWIYYVSPVGLTNDDEFTYTTQDIFGQLTTGIVLVKTALQVPEPFISLTDLGSGLKRLRVDGMPELVYRGESVDEVGSSDWIDLGGIPMDETGVFERYFSRQEASQRFFRAVVAGASRTVKLEWESSSDQNVRGYRVYIGTSSGNYSRSVDAYSQTTLEIPGLLIGTTYYFSAVAYDYDMVESAPTPELSYTVPE